MKLIIDRTKWLRGEGCKDSKLLRESDGKMCCLGMYSIAKGYSEPEILETQEPQELDRAKQRVPELCSINGGLPSENARRMMNINDSTEMSSEERECLLTKWFSLIGVEVEFIN